MARRSATAIILSHLEFDLLWEDLGAGDPPYPLEVPSHGETMAERDELGVAVFRTLAGANLVDGEDVVPELEELFTLLATSSLSVDALVFRPKPWRVLAAMRGPRGVLAVLNDHEVALEPITDLIHAVSRVVGEAPPGPGDQLRIPRAAFKQAVESYAARGYQGLERTLAAAGVTGRAVRSIATLIESGRGAAGQLAVTGPAGRSSILSWTDTDAGRYAMTTETLANEPWVLVSPADNTWLTRKLSELLSTTTP